MNGAREELTEIASTLRAVDAVVADALRRYVEIEQSVDMDQLHHRDDLTDDEALCFETFEEVYYLAMLVAWRSDYWAGGSIVPNAVEVAERFDLPDGFVEHAERVMTRSDATAKRDVDQYQRIRDLEGRVFEFVVADGLHGHVDD